MKVSIVLTDATVLATIISGDCFSTRLGSPCCYSSTEEVWFTDSDREMGY